MDTNNSKQAKTVCEKLRRAIQTTSPFRAMRFTSQQVHSDAAVATAASPNVSLMNPTPPSDRCPRVLKQSDNLVPVIFRYSGEHSTGAARKGTQIVSSVTPIAHQGKPAKVAQTGPTVLPIHGRENRVPPVLPVGEKSPFAESINGMFSEYIDRAGRKIRAPTNVGVGKSSGMRHDSFNDKVSDFIGRAKNKFHNTPSIN